MKASMFWMAVFTQAWGAKYQSLMKLNAGAADDHEEQKECVVVSGTYFCTLDGNKEYQFALTEACKGVMSEEIEYTVAGNTLTLVGKGLTATVDAAGNFDFGSAGMCRNVATVAMAVAAPAPAPPPPASPANLKFSTTAEACAWCSFYRKDCKCMCYADGSGGVMQYCVSPKPPVHGSGGIAAVNDWTNGTECA
eukprot:CAMPEP_0197658832 /NCGR_PEP_ID=MMETSP1338-20131121/45472_1 /TAXON_ID=43686 ORGANISM="Pelagodinium beii, Strain RCC1491" /NCGR_SAMPLE_ID=MMETSP1338 /ASSEMBLY_ACC=CAM_ASM_000754 /LENGTH=193 /DNA_ID=CAMNT_0043235495 /DNA_START=65 /DNA_END=646 /DNA_ORIENTATION=+